MDESIRNESKTVQQLITKYFSVNEWRELPENLRFRYLLMVRKYDKVERFNEEWAVNPTPTSDFIKGKKKKTNSELFKRQKSPEFKLPTKRPAPESIPAPEPSTSSIVVNPTPTPDFIKGKEKKTVSKLFKRPKSAEIKLPTKRPAPESIPSPQPSTSTAVGKRNPKRNVPLKNYFEEQEPENDRYVFCDNCQKEYVDYCSKCGMLICLENNNVPMGTPNRAKKTVPTGILEIKLSSIHGFGVFALKKIQKGVRMGPYEGNVTKVETTQGYAWKLKYSQLIDASDESNSNYLRYVNCAKNIAQQNVIAFQYKGQLYYRTCRDILEGEELLVYYGTSFAKNLGIDTKKYFEPVEEERQQEYFSCKYCKIGLSTKEYRSTHENYCKFQPSRKKIDVTNIFVCKHCKAGITSEKVLIFHEKRCEKNEETIQKKNGMDGNQKNYKCDYCEYVAKQKSHLKKHIQIIHEKENTEIFYCKHCEFKTYYKGVLNRHIKRHEGHTPGFVCTSCNKGFTVKYYLDCHILKNHPDEIDRITKNIKYCKFCCYKTLFASNLKKHMFTHKKESKKNYSCSKCEYSTNDKSDLKRHLLIHNDIKLYICIECKKGFNRKQNLDSHIINKHSNNKLLCESMTNKIYTCEICKHKCINRTDFKKHLSTHTGQKSHFCSECKKGFIQKQQLDSHILNNHKKNNVLIKSISSKIHSCNDCSYQTVLTSSFKYHLKTHAKNLKI